MIVCIDDRVLSEKVGNKAKFLMVLRERGFNVPDGFVLDSDTYDEILRFNNKEEQITETIRHIGKDNLKQVSRTIHALLDDLEFPEDLVENIRNRLQVDVKYAVRSSGLKEDLEGFSFAGQYATILNVSGIDGIKAAVVSCYKSMYTETILTYLLNNSIGTTDLKMPVIIQEMVPADISGIAFTINPLTGDDKEIVVEAAPGLGDNIVSGKVVPERYFFNWYTDDYAYAQTNKLLSEQMLNCLTQTMLSIQLHFGYPCDVEFAVSKGMLYILQSRAITKIMYSKIRDQWSTADFKDGGVSATVCTPFMWSLYEYAWDTTLKRYLTDSYILNETQIRKLSNLFFGRPYWNMSVVKSGMARVPGYKEREFDSEFGVKITYEGNGKTTKITPKAVLKILLIALKQKRLLKEQLENVETYKQELLSLYEGYLDESKNGFPTKDFEQLWVNLVKHEYLRSEGTYFWQIFLNTVHQALFKSKLLKIVGKSEFFNLISGLDNISHLLPFYDMWEIGRKIVKNPDAFEYWNTSSVVAIKADYENKVSGNYLKEVSAFIEAYGYHSEKELDITYPCYFETPESILKMFKENILLDESTNPAFDRQKQKAAYAEELLKIKAVVSEKRYAKLLKGIERMRLMLWWREELRDMSTRFYYILRVYTMELARVYTEKGVFNDIDDIWYLKIEDVFDYINHSKTRDALQKTIDRNRNYYSSFRHFTSENEIGAVFDKEAAVNNRVSKNIHGIGCNNGLVTGTARIIESLEEIDNLRMDDILVTKFTDTGWTSKFAILKGIVTEYGGILCHAAIVSREYGIPCVVSVTDAMKRIKDGSTISVNGETGEIVILHE